MSQCSLGIFSSRAADGEVAWLWRLPPGAATKVENTEAVRQASKVNSREYMVIIYGCLTIDYLFQSLI